MPVTKQPKFSRKFRAIAISLFGVFAIVAALSMEKYSPSSEKDPMLAEAEAQTQALARGSDGDDAISQRVAIAEQLVATRFEDAKNAAAGLAAPSSAGKATQKLDEDTPQAFINQMLTEGKTEADCKDFATESIKAIKISVKSAQGILDTLENGDDCTGMGQDEIAQAKTDLDAKIKIEKEQGTRKKPACETQVTFKVNILPQQDVQLGEYDWREHQTYKDAKKACKTAHADHEKARDGVKEAEGELKAKRELAAELQKRCYCRVKTAQAEGWKSAQEATTSRAAEWKKARAVLCALGQDAVDNCVQNKEAPKVTRPRVAQGVKDLKQGDCTTPAPSHAPTPNPAPIRRLSPGEAMKCAAKHLAKCDASVIKQFRPVIQDCTSVVGLHGWGYRGVLLGRACGTVKKLCKLPEPDLVNDGHGRMDLKEARIQFKEARKNGGYAFMKCGASKKDCICTHA